MAKIDVIMPQMGESIAEGTLSRWIKKVGDAVKRDEPIFEISTDKVDAEIPAPAAGMLAEILVQEGQTVAVQTVVARIETDASSRREARPGGARCPGSRVSSAGTRRLRRVPRRAGSGLHAGPRSRLQLPRLPAAPGSRTGGARGTAASNPRRSVSAGKSTPLVRKMAAEHNVDISAIPGTGLAGRVTKNDMLEYLERGRRGARGTGGLGSRPPLRRGCPAHRGSAPGAGAQCRSLGGRPGRALVADPEAHRRAHGHVAAGLAPRQHHLRDRLHPRGADPRRGRRRNTPTAA